MKNAKKVSHALSKNAKMNFIKITSCFHFFSSGTVLIVLLKNDNTYFVITFFLLFYFMKKSIFLLGGLMFFATPVLAETLPVCGSAQDTWLGSCQVVSETSFDAASLLQDPQQRDDLPVMKSVDVIIPVDNEVYKNLPEMKTLPIEIPPAVLPEETVLEEVSTESIPSVESEPVVNSSVETYESLVQREMLTSSEEKLSYPVLLKSDETTGLNTPLPAPTFSCPALVHTITVSDQKFPLSDLTEQQLGYDALQALVARGIVPDSLLVDNNANIESSVSRSDVAQMVVFATQLEYMAPKCIEANAVAFADVVASDEFYSYVQALKDTEVVHGYADNMFKPEQDVTLAEMYKIIAKGFGFTQASDSLEVWYAPYKEVLMEKNIILPNILKKNDGDIATRADVYRMMWEAMKNMPR